MSRLFFLILTAVALSITSCRNIKADSSTESLPVLLDMLDNDLDNSETYEKARLARISAIRSMDDDAGYPDGMRYNQNMMLYREYFPYQFDSAFHYINENIGLSRQMQSKNHLAESTVELAMLFTVAGMYLEAKEILASQIDTVSLSKSQLVRYYIVQHRLR